MPSSTAAKPSATIRRGDVVGKNFGTPAAASSIVTESGVILSPVSMAESPSATDRNSGTTKKSPIITDELEEEHQETAVQSVLFDEHRG